MLKTEFRLNLPWRVIVYLRVSQPGQNPRSPDQQKDVIDGLMRKLRLPWVVVKIYRDDFISGRLTRRRKQFHKMLRDLRCGAVKADLVLVDTFERFSRAKDADALRQKLKSYGALLLTADSGFADPTTTQGEALAFVEKIRAVEEGRVKAHNVLRGKRDAVLRNQWPGGPVPFGLELWPVMKTIGGRQEFSHNELRPDPHCRWMVAEMFRLADELGFGTSRIAARLNADPNIPEEFKPFHPATIGSILDSLIYQGTYVYGKNCTGIVDDVRLVQPLPEDEWIIKHEFCEAIVDPARCERVRMLRQARRDERLKQKKDADENESQPRLEGLHVPGLALKYILSGLVRCKRCKRSMTAQASRIYVTVTGEERRYVSYACTGNAGEICENRTRIPEPWLRNIVISLVRERLGLTKDLSTETVREFLQHVQAEWEKLDAAEPDDLASLLAEKQQLEELCRGWRQTLGNSSLSPMVRAEVEAEYERAKARIFEIDGMDAAKVARREMRRRVLEPEAVVERLSNFDDIIGGDNATAAHVMLAHHIDAIWCDETGHVVVRTCKLGAIAGDLDLFREDSFDSKGAEADANLASYVAHPRRRGRLNIGGAIDDDDAAAEANDFATDPARFAGLGPQWFCEDHFDVPEDLSWSQENAKAVAQHRLEFHTTMEATAQHFGKSVPTIRHALEYARDEHGIDALGKDVSRATRKVWSKENAQAVADFMRVEGRTQKEAAAHFGKSIPTIKKALEFARASAEQEDRASDEAA